MPQSREEIESAFENLKADGYELTNPETPEYNCIAYAAGDAGAWWWPHPTCYWPTGLQRVATMDIFIAAFESLGYAQCADGSVEEGTEKIVLYVDGNGAPTHAVRQLSTGRWTSKLGMWEDVEHHSPIGLSGSSYGEPVVYMSRRNSTSTA